MISTACEKYTAYKDSGVEWLGEMPTYWEVKRLKDFASIVRGGSPRPAGDLRFYEGEIPFLKVGDLTSDEKVYLDRHTHTIKEAGLSNTRFVASETLMLTNSGATLGIPKICIFPTTFNDGIAAFINLKNISKVFLFYLLKSRTRWYLNQVSLGQGQPNLNTGIISNTFFSSPPLAEQKVIADYLDRETAQIDRKIDLLTRKAEQYGQLKRSLISEIITCGLNKSVVMNDSGVEWIGEIPAHWEIKRVNDIAVRRKSKNTGLVEKNLLSLSYGKIIRRNFDTSFGLLPASFETYQIVDSGNIILRLTDLQNDWKSLRVGLAKERGIITSAYLCLHFSKSIYTAFAYYLLFVYDILKIFYRLGGGLRQSMKWEDIKILFVILPPLSEQKAIADYLDAQTAHINRVIETIHTQIENLRELRKTLINDVVTGKIKVI